MKSKKGGKRKGIKKKSVSRSRKKKFSLEFNFGGLNQAKENQISNVSVPAAFKKEKAEKTIKPLKVKEENKETVKEVKQIEPIKTAQEIKPKKKSDPAIILLFLMFLVGVMVIALAFVFKDYFIYYISSGVLILIINIVFFLIHKRNSRIDGVQQEKKEVKEQKPVKLEQNKAEDKKLEAVAAQKNVQIEPIDIKKEKAKLINLVVTVFVLGVIIYFAISKGFISNISLPKSFGLVEAVVSVVILAVILMIFNARRRGKKRKELIKKATQAVISGKVSASQINLPKQLGGRIIVDGQEVKLKKYQTEFDLLLEMINEKKSIPMSDIEKMFSVSKDLAEEWGRILEEHNLIKVYYPALGDPLFRANTFIEVKKKKVKKTDGLKSN